MRALVKLRINGDKIITITITSDLLRRKDIAREAQRAFSKGLISQVECAEAQRAYDVAAAAARQPNRVAERAKRSAEEELMWKSLLKLTDRRLYELAKAADRVRTIGGRMYFVPPTSHWANWMDVDAVRHHGVVEADQAQQRFVSWRLDSGSTEPWDGTYADLWGLVDHSQSSAR